VKSLIERYEAKGNWTFAFFGEGVEAWSQARDFGYAKGAAMAYTRDNMRGVYDAKAQVSNMMRREKIRATRRFAEATRAAVEDGATEEDLRRILHKDPAGPPSVER
jgi:hypothetical protein